MTVEQAHEICDRLEAALMEALDEAVVTIHVEPGRMAEHCVSSEAMRPALNRPPRSACRDAMVVAAVAHAATES